ncbi:uncharacterized protein LOC132723254 [Ruditapes philippinarum]|uniref:uncharacterized protein LOC132723254 n=1 Tax=Ruditapes philippinarum TaxID=129788 RepID=UPI00295C2A6E|nr:uncharacterized protein LOC132723254 [Ruditapes philippinarum]
MMDKFGKSEDKYISGSSSGSEESEQSWEDNTEKHSLADGRNPELEFLLGHTEPKQIESPHSRRQDVVDTSNSVLESLLGVSEPQYTDRYASDKHHEASQVTIETKNSNVVNPLSEMQSTKNINVETQSAKFPYVESSHAPARQSVYKSDKNVYSRTSQYCSYPVIDMTKAHQIGRTRFYKIRVQSSSLINDLKFEVSQMFNVSISKVHIIEEEGQKEEVLLKIIIVILPDNVGEEYCPLLVEVFELTDQFHPEILCIRLPVRQTIKDIKKLLAEELRWKGLVLCQNGNVLEDNLQLRSCNFKLLARIQALKQSYHRIDFVYQPRSDVSCSYSLDLDMNSSLEQVKRQFAAQFHDEIQKLKGTEESTFHLCFQGRLLKDEECVGLVLRKNIKEEKITLHFGAQVSISIDLKFRVRRKTKHKLLIVSKKISTTSLRTEVSKHLGVDPKAVKLTFDDKLLDEHDDLSRVYKEHWQNGCRIAAGIKKHKTLRIKHPIECGEEPFEMYMLDPVSALKRKIAEQWGLKLLQISLFCRGIMMEYDQPLQYYPIKNNMEISLQLFQHRIILKVVILSGKKRISLIIDNSETTTGDDLLRFCAHHFQYARERSRGIFKDHCIDRTCSLADQGVKSGDTVIISYFDQPNLLQGNLINIFMVHENGHMVKRLGAVNSGLLLHAPKTAEAPQTEDTCLDNGPIPAGISICDTKEAAVSSLPRQMLKSNLKNVNAKENSQSSTKDIMKNKSKFLNRAWRVIQQKYSKPHEQLNIVAQVPKESHESTPTFYLGGEPEELDLDEETGRKTVVACKNMPGEVGRENSNTEVKSLATDEQNPRAETPINIEVSERRDQSQRYEGCVRGEIESDGPICEDNEICQKVKCIENCCKKICEIQREKVLNEFPTDNITTSTPSEFDPNCNTRLTSKPSETMFKNSTKKASFDLPNDLSGCDTETSGCESSHNKNITLNIAPHRWQRAEDTDSSDIDHVTSSHGEDCQCRKCLLSGRFTRCPFLRQQMNSRGNIRRKPRHHTLSESSVACYDLLPRYQASGHMHLSRTFPSMRDRFPEPNSDIETSGITIPLLSYVAKCLGKKWRQLLRSLKVGETEMDEIEHRYKDHGLVEVGIEALITWKRGMGSDASKDRLLKALADIGLKSVAENCENVGYQTA